MMMWTENIGHAVLILVTLLIMAILVIIAVAFAVKVGIQLNKEVDSGALDFVYDEDDDEDVSEVVPIRKNERKVVQINDQKHLDKESILRFHDFYNKN